MFVDEGEESGRGCIDNPDTAAVIGIKGASVIFTGVAKLKADDTDWSERRPKRGFWRELTKVADTLSGRNGIFEGEGVPQN